MNEWITTVFVGQPRLNPVCQYLLSGQNLHFKSHSRQSSLVGRHIGYSWLLALVQLRNWGTIYLNGLPRWTCHSATLSNYSNFFVWFSVQIQLHAESKCQEISVLDSFQVPLKIPWSLLENKLCMFWNKNFTGVQWYPRNSPWHPWHPLHVPLFHEEDTGEKKLFAESLHGGRKCGGIDIPVAPTDSASTPFV